MNIEPLHYKWQLGDWRCPSEQGPKVVVRICNSSISVGWGCKRLRVRRCQTRRLDAFILIRARVLQWFHVLSTIQDSNCWALHHLLENEFTWPLWPAESHESIKPPPSLPSLVDRHAAMILLLTSNEYRAPSLQMTVGGLEMPQRTRS